MCVHIFRNFKRKTSFTRKLCLYIYRRWNGSYVCIFKAHSAKVAAAAINHCALVRAHSISGKKVCARWKTECKRERESKLQPSTLKSLSCFEGWINQPFTVHRQHKKLLCFAWTLHLHSFQQRKCSTLWVQNIFSCSKRCSCEIEFVDILAEKYSHPRCLVHEFHEFINRKKIMTQNVRWYWYHSQINQSKMASAIVTSTTTTPEMNDKCSQF